MARVGVSIPRFASDCDSLNENGSVKKSRSLLADEECISTES